MTRHDALDQQPVGGVAGFTQPADPDVLRAWRTGARWWHVVAAVLDDPAVEHRRRQVARALAGLVDPTTPGQGHVTLWVAGVEPPRLPARLPSLPVTITGAATYRSAAYLRAAATDGAAIREDLAALNPTPQLPFDPHVTVGTYRAAVPLAEVARLLVPHGALTPLRVTARIRHLVVDTRDPTGSLHPA